MSELTCVTCGRPKYGGASPSLMPGVFVGTCQKCGSGAAFREKVSDPPPVAHARSTDPETSHAAARSVTDIRQTQLDVLDALADGPKTDEEVWEHVVNYAPEKVTSPSGFRTRRSELVAKGLVRDSGERRRLSTGRRAIVWEAVPRQ